MKLRSLPVAAAAAVLAAMSGVAGQLPARAATAVIPITPNGTSFTINNGPGDQTDPHVSGDWVSYTDNSAGYYQVRYHNLATGQDTVIPSNGGQDLLSGISGTTIVYMHSTAAGQSIYAYDIGSGSAPAEVDPAPGSIREFPAIGGRTVAWADYTNDPSHPQIMVENLDTQQVTTLTNDTAMQNLEPSVSPDGSVVTWAKCTGSFSGCNVWDAVLGSGGVVEHQLTSDSASELPHTDGQIVVYDSTRNGQQDIYWQPVTGGPEQTIAFPGPDKNPHISGNLIVFDHFDTTASIPNWDVYAYSLITQTLYRITSDLTDETLSDVSVTPDGLARVVWNTLESDYNVYGFEFQSLTETPAGLCRLTVSDVQSSAKYQALPPAQRAAIDHILTGICDQLATITPQLTPQQLALLIAAYKTAVLGLARGGWLTAAQASTLTFLADHLTIT